MLPEPIVEYHGLTTICPDTPEQWRRFHAMLDRINTPAPKKFKPRKRRTGREYAPRRPILIFGFNTCKG